MLRSKQGCWTCRLRRKKCDERRPSCSTCEALTITCYGYGSRPDWMDNGDQEKAMANSIKEIVKHTSRRKGRLGLKMSRFHERYIGQKRDNSNVWIAPKSIEASSDLSPSSGPESTGGSRAPGSDSNFPAQSIELGSSTSPGSTQGESDAVSISWSSPEILSTEAALLMHFLDNVFPLQYPMYRPSANEGGRGWLLSLLLRTKPLYHASLGLSAYHRGVVLLEAQRNGCRAINVVQQEKHLAICLKEFRQGIENLGELVKNQTCPKNALGFMACVVQLVFFELFAGHGNAWQIHLSAGTDMLYHSYWEQFAPFGFAESLDTTSHHDTTLAQPEECPPSEKQVISTFLCGVLLWLDILSSITTGKSPRLQSFQSHATTSGPRINLKSIMGCENWAMIQIGRVAALQEYKTQALQHDYLDTVDFEVRADGIRQELLRGLTEQSLSSLGISYADHTTSAISVITCQMLITRLWALAASIYLHVVVHDFHLETQELNSTITEAMMILRTQITTDLLMTIICPLYIIGCVARKEDREFFRCVFSSAPVLDPSLEHRGKILPLLEEIWRIRDTTMGQLTWQDSLRFQEHNILLL